MIIRHSGESRSPKTLLDSGFRRNDEKVRPPELQRYRLALCALVNWRKGRLNRLAYAKKSTNWLLIWFGRGLLTGEAGETTGTSYIQTLQSLLPYRAIWAMTLKSTKFVP